MFFYTSGPIRHTELSEAAVTPALGYCCKNQAVILPNSSSSQERL